ncbi:MAG: Antilisterial bacteriocin subtilosin biosynthesis protein AlbA [Verrucomicrobia bacterium ADurb.Bin345]|nr:MAG: Antilisterial bacteriocin subtilosin biosynthesis protein AlbA [Verrucomicrobia bacterium ADurb.Bin345]
MRSAGPGDSRGELGLEDWKRLVDELAAHGIGHVLLRGGETFLFPGIIELLDYIISRNIAVAMDTNGTLLGRYAEDLVRLEYIHLTVSVDGPEPIHDQVRGVKGCFGMVRDGLARLAECERRGGITLSKALCFVISPYSVRGLGAMPDVARGLGIGTIAIVPYYYVPDSLGRLYEEVLRKDLGCAAFSWRGFHHEDSGVDIDVFREQLRIYLANLKGLQSYPYMPFTEDEYATWFSDPAAPVGRHECNNVERLVDIQPDGNANFCVDFPDYSIGNVMDASIEDLWNSSRAERFREYRRATPLPVCHRCGAKYMS